MAEIGIVDPALHLVKTLELSPCVLSEGKNWLLSILPAALGELAGAVLESWPGR